MAASRPSATTSSVGRWAPAEISAQELSVASASTIMIATSPSSVTRPATTMSKTARSRNATHCPSMSATRTPATGPENGNPLSWVDNDAALMARTS